MREGRYSNQYCHRVKRDGEHGVLGNRIEVLPRLQLENNRHPWPFLHVLTYQYNDKGVNTVHD